MNTICKRLIIGLTVLGLAGSTFAVQAQDAKPGAAHEQHGTSGEMHARHAEHRAKRMQKLHDALKLTPAQETAWASYSTAITPAQHAQRGQRGDWKAMTAPERMEQQLAMAKERVAMMETRLAATSSFYGSLRPEQKKLFDEHSKHLGGHRHHMKHGMAS